MRVISAPQRLRGLTYGNAHRVRTTMVACRALEGSRTPALN